jgi:AcrR family transcriptional regulator
VNERVLTSAGRTTREQILDAAMDMFADKGFAGTSMRALGRAVGMKESALYHYFESKEQLFQAMLELVLERRAKLFEAEVGSSSKRPLGEILTNLARFLMAHLETPLERKFWRIIMAEGPRLPGTIETLHKLMYRHRQNGIKLVETLQARGLIRKDIAPEIFLVHFFAPIIVASNAPMGGGKGPITMNKEQFIKGHVAFLLAAVKP